MKNKINKWLKLHKENEDVFPLFLPLSPAVAAATTTWVQKISSEL